MNAMPTMMRWLLAVLVAVAPLAMPRTSLSAESAHGDRSALKERQDEPVLLFLANRTDGHLTLLPKSPAAPAWAPQCIFGVDVPCWREELDLPCAPGASSPHRSLLQLKSLLTI
ncbi:MAG: hypothetical protein ABFD92_08205 [Planctomycetaceae bacterium]|nr:hypothetical protein [Planctomycetaceae bacterium]